MPTTKITRPGKSAPAIPSSRHIVVVMKNAVSLSTNDKKAIKQVLASDPKGWGQIDSNFGAVQLRRHLSPKTRQIMHDLIKRKRSTAPDFQFPSRLEYFWLPVPPKADAWTLAQRISRLKGVSRAYVEPQYSTPLVNVTSDQFLGSQGHLRSAPEGIGIQAVWPQVGNTAAAPPLGFPGADGVGQELVDVEFGFLPAHEDLESHFHPNGLNDPAPLHGWNSPAKAQHGTQVLGVVCAKNNTTGVCGIVPNLSSLRFASVSDESDTTCEDALTAALSCLCPAHSPRHGGVLLVELQIDDFGQPWDLMPMEVAHLPVRDVLRLAWAMGVIVVEPAGNGCHDLDHFPWGDYVNLVEAARRYVDGGTEAIMVAASDAVVPHTQLISSTTSGSNIGSRIDCFAWGKHVQTCSTTVNEETDLYCDDFGGTSAASAIIAGAVLSIQGIAQTSIGRRLWPEEVRSLLCNPDLCTPPDRSMRGKMGLMPDMEKIAPAIERYFYP